MRKNVRNGISPVLATVIIIAVTLVIAVAVVGWIMGIWGGLGGLERLMIMPDSRIFVASNGSVIVELHLKNEGTSDIVITKIEVSGLGGIWTGSKTVPVGDNTYGFVLTGASSPSIGGYYTVKVYTASGSVYTAVVRVLS